MSNSNNNYRGHGRGGLRGPTNNRRHGRGQGWVNRGRGRGGGHDQTEQPDFVVQMWPDNNASSGNGSPRSRGGAGISFSSPNSGRATPSRGSNSPRGRGRGNVDQNPTPRGRANRGSKLRPDAPLSSLLYSERPLLKPVVFVPSVYTRTLFQEEEEILQATAGELEDKEKSHVPTADRIARVFSRSIEQMESSASNDSESDEDELEEFDFADMGKIRDGIDTTAPLTQQLDFVDERLMGFAIESTSTPTPVQANNVIDCKIHQNTQRGQISLEQYSDPCKLSSQSSNEPPVISEEVPHPDQNEHLDFFVDTSPTPATFSARGTNNEIITHRAEGVLPLGEEASTEPDEIIVYVAPHPRTGKAAPGKAAPAIPAPSIPSFPSTSIVTGTTGPSTSIRAPSNNPEQLQQLASISSPPTFDSISFSFSDSPNLKKQPRHPPVFTPGTLSKAKFKAHKKEARVARKVERQALFGSFGAIMQEAQLRGQGKDPRWKERRRDDSDLDWGDEGGTEEQDGADGLSSGVGAMDLDPSLKLDVEVLKRFVSGMSANGGRFVTMDDIADEQRMRSEDEDVEERGSSGREEEDEVVKLEERQMIGEPAEDKEEEGEISSDEGDISDGVDASPRTGFQARLERLRHKARSKKAIDEDSSDDDGMLHDQPWADQDEEFIAHIEDVVMENDGIVHGTRKERNRLFKAIQNGNAADMADMSPACKSNKGKQKRKDIPPDLAEQWEKDRAKKAENKRARQQARLQHAADPLSNKKGGKKGCKAMLAAARLDSSAPIENRVVDMSTLVQQIRRFLADVGGRPTMVLPPMDKPDRAMVHELANAFHIKSQSKNGGKGRYTTLIKTTMSGVGISEKKIRKIVGRSGKGTPVGADKGNLKGTGVPRHKEGDEVGKAAPKIGQSNIGFKMLSSMGWTEGDRIGASADGLHAPLTAVIKNTKLGLGANR